LYQNNRPQGKALTNVVARVGVLFNYRITVLNPGDDHAFDYFWCLPSVPPGLNLNTNLGGSGFITGVPTAAGSYRVQLVAGNALYAVPASLDAWLQVEPALAPPTITAQPQSKSVVAAQPASFSVSATGTAPLTYQWFANGVALGAATNATLSIASAWPSQQGQYWVVVGNSEGTVTSSKVILTVQEPLTVSPVLDRWNVGGGQFGFRISGPAGLPQVVWASTNFQDWVARTTNASPDGVWNYSESTLDGPRFFRVLVVP
jgi:hypothetical protein